MWNTHLPEQSNPVAKSIVNFCKSEEVSAVALATYGTKCEDEVQTDQPFFQNSQLFFCDETQSDTLRRQWNAFSKVQTGLTHKTIANMPLRGNQVGFVALTALPVGCLLQPVAYLLINLLKYRTYLLRNVLPFLGRKVLG